MKVPLTSSAPPGGRIVEPRLIVLVGGLSMTSLCGPAFEMGLTVTVVALAVCGLIYALVQAGRLRLASVLFVFTTWALNFANWNHGIVSPMMMAYALPVVAAALLLGTWGAALTTLASMAGVSILAYVQYRQALEAGAFDAALRDDLTFFSPVSWFIPVLLSLLSGLVTARFRRWAEETDRIARQLIAAAVVSDTAATTTSVESLLNVVVERIREAFGFYHAQVFLLDPERRTALLRASTGPAGEKLLEIGHSLPVGSQSVIGQCTYRGEAVVINDVLKDPIHRPNEYLPDTRAELALPLIIGSEVSGALDVQSTANSFHPQDVNALQLMANQLATAIEKARLLDELQARAEENRRLFEEAQNSLREIEELNRRLTRSSWQDYIQTRRGKTPGYTIHEGDVAPATNWTGAMRQAYQSEHSVIIQQDQQAHIAAVPIRVRGQVIGVLEVERGGERAWNDNEIEMAETLADRLALAIENARLYEQATMAATRARLVNEITQEVQRAETVDEILQAALAELGAVLGASRGVIQINPGLSQDSDGDGASASEADDQGGP